MASKEPKLVAYTGHNTIAIKEWLNLFEVILSSLKITDDKDKAIKLMSYLDDSALTYYALHIAPKMANITWADVRHLMETRFGLQTISPIVASVRRILTKADTIESYYKEKMSLLDRTALSEEHKADLLTEGLPKAYQLDFHATHIPTPQEWLKVALKVEADTNHYSQPKSPFVSAHTKSSLCTVSHCEPDKALCSGSANTSHKPKHTQLPVCQICRNVGLSSRHWHKDCPQKGKQQSTPQYTVNSAMLCLTSNHDDDSGRSTTTKPTVQEPYHSLPDANKRHAEFESPRKGPINESTKPSAAHKILALEKDGTRKLRVGHHNTFIR
jgi:hypothetical protein